MSAPGIHDEHNADASKVCSKTMNNPCIIPGADLWKFYSKPLDCGKPGDVYDSEEEVECYTISSDEDTPSVFISTGSQTDFRESEAQTEPWDPPYIVHCKYKEPEILQFKNLSFGKGLPVGQVEINYILEKREISHASTQSDSIDTEDFFKKKQAIRDQFKMEWKYKISKHNQEQIEKLRLMEAALAEELRKQTEKQDMMLKSIWSKKKTEVIKKNSKFRKTLCKELQSYEPRSCSAEKGSFTENSKGARKAHASKTVVNEDNDYKLDSQALPFIKNWLETKKSILKNQIPLIKPFQKIKSEKIIEKAYENLLEKKRAYIPPKTYHENYDREESPTPTVKSDVEFEALDLPDEGIDLATVWQQILRGRAYQKQMLELIERHKDALDVHFLDQIYGKK